MEAHIVFDDDAGTSVLMVYERGDGYFQGPRGRRCPLHVRPGDQLVPLLEIEKLLLHMEFDPSTFWDFSIASVDQKSETGSSASSPKRNRFAGFLNNRPSPPEV
jgi:hypothetical protein